MCIRAGCARSAWHPALRAPRLQAPLISKAPGASVSHVRRSHVLLESPRDAVPVGVYGELCSSSFRGGGVDLLGLPQAFQCAGTCKVWHFKYLCWTCWNRLGYQGYTLINTHCSQLCSFLACFFWVCCLLDIFHSSRTENTLLDISQSSLSNNGQIFLSRFS